MRSCSLRNSPDLIVVELSSDCLLVVGLAGVFGAGVFD